MELTPSVRYRKGDKSPTGDGRLFLQYKLGRECWVTPTQLVRSNQLARRACRKYSKSEHGSAKKKAYGQRPDVKAKKAYIARTNPRCRASKLKSDRSKKAKDRVKRYLARHDVRERRRIYYNAYYHEDKERHNAYQRRYIAKNINAAIGKRLRCLVRNTIVAFGGRKSAMTDELVGCSVARFIKHMESQFTEGMTWKNIHIDHIVPCSAFDLTDPEQQKLCFNWRNCQPKFNRDNLAKSDKIEGELFRGRDLRKIVQFRAA